MSNPFVKRVTMRDLAEYLGRSVGTISRALNNEPGLSKENRDAIVQAAQQFGYDLNAVRPHRMRRILFLLHTRNNTDRASDFYSAVMHGAEAACRERRLTLSFMAIDPADNIVDRLRGQGFDAIICAGFFEPELLAALRNTGRRLVLIDAKVHGYSSVNPDNMRGAYLATRHLLRNGRSRIGLITASTAQYSIRERTRGFRTALFEANKLQDPRYEVVVPDGLNMEDGVCVAVQSLLGLSRRPDAILCYNDAAALIAIRSCRLAGVDVPGDISVVGFDNIPDAALGFPALTTIHVDQQELGRHGVEILCEAEPCAQIDKSVPVELIVRASTAPAVRRQPR